MFDRVAYYTEKIRYYNEQLSKSLEETTTEDLVDHLDSLVNALNGRGIHVTFVFGSSGNRMELFDLNKGLHIRPDYTIPVPTEGDILNRIRGRD